MNLLLFCAIFLSSQFALSMEYMTGTDADAFSSQAFEGDQATVVTKSAIKSVEYKNLPKEMAPVVTTRSRDTIVIQTPPPAQPVCVFPPAAPVIINSPAISQLIHEPASLMPSKQSTSSLLGSCVQFVQTHPYITAGVSVVALSYSCLLYRCWHTNNYVERTDTWSAWKMAVPLSVLKERDQKEIAQALITDIKKRYHVDTDDAYTLTDILATFSQELETELKKLNTYQAFIEYLDGSRLRIVLPDLQQLNVTLADRIERILYLKDILHTILSKNCPVPSHNTQ